MGRKRKTGKLKTRGVYFQQGKWRYKARNAEEREKLGALWTILGKTEEEAAQNYSDRIAKVLGLSGGMQLLWERYLKTVVPLKAIRTQKENIGDWAIVSRSVKNSHPSELTRAGAIAYVEARAAGSIFKDLGPAPSRAKKEFALLRHMLNKAVDWEIIDRNPLQGLRISDYVKVDVRDRVPEVWELQAVMKYCPLFYRLFIDFKYQTGLDQNTIFDLKVPNFTGPGLTVKRSKTHKKGYIEWTPEFIGLCRAIIAHNNNKSDYLFCNQRGGQMKVDSFSQYFRRYVLKAIELGELVEPFRPNDIRSSHATDAEEIHGLDATQQLLNCPGAKKHYVHLRKGQKITALPSVRSK